MLRCREIAKLVSESMEQQLPLRKRMEVWLHLKMCRMCAAFARHLRLLRRAAHEAAGQFEADSDVRLPEPARRRIKSILEDGS